MFKLVQIKSFPVASRWRSDALIIMEYSYLDVFRPGFLSNV